MPGRLAAAAALALVAGCTNPPAPGPEPARPSNPSSSTAAAPGAPALEVVSACPADMVLVEGRFCPEADERCEKYHPEYEADHDATERCLRFTEPSRCASKRRVVVRYCVDRYEWPNREGELPRVLVDWNEAKASCESAGKRLCDESEWLFACEGESMLPYVNGYLRDATACAIDRPYVERPHVLERWDACMATPDCRQEFQRVDQRAASGSFERCVSPFGAHDMNGNVNEWVNVPGEKFPRRSALKGGWWGPVRNRCRPTVRFHDESDWGYEIGFRCCADARP